MSAEVVSDIVDEVKQALGSYTVSSFPSAHFTNNTITISDEVEGLLVLVTADYTFEVLNLPVTAAPTLDGKVVFLICHVLEDRTWAPFVPSSTVRYEDGAAINVASKC